MIASFMVNLFPGYAAVTASPTRFLLDFSGFDGTPGTAIVRP